MSCPQSHSQSHSHSRPEHDTGYEHDSPEHVHHDHHGHRDRHDHRDHHGHRDHRDFDERMPPREKSPLPKPSGAVLFVDPIGGVAGDMFVAALLDLGVPRSVLDAAVAALDLGPVELVQGRRVRASIAAMGFEVHPAPDQPWRDWAQIDRLLAQAPLTPATKDRSRRVFRHLAHAEAQMHDVAPEQVHFHEVGAVDSIVDIVGTCALLSWLDPSRVVVAPLPLGYGTISSAHGMLPLPAPATVACLAGVPTYGVSIDGETVTPTGAALVACLADEFAPWPAMRVIRSGYGAGSKDWKQRSNLLRLVLGDPQQPFPVGKGLLQAGFAGPDGAAATHAVVEVNLDDITGEHMGQAIRDLMDSGALDVWCTGTTTKKGRPGAVLSVLVPADQAHHYAHLVLRYTTSWGVRMYPVARVELARRVQRVATRFGTIAVKFAADPSPGSLPRYKPEFDDCLRAARENDVPVARVFAEVHAAVVQAGADRTDRAAGADADPVDSSEACAGAGSDPLTLPISQDPPTLVRQT